MAADREIEMARFDGRPVIQAPVSDGIHKARELIEKAVSGQVPVYRHVGGGEGISADGGGDGLGRKIYKHLMNGVSHMLPFVIGGESSSHWRFCWTTIPSTLPISERIRLWQPI